MADSSLIKPRLPRGFADRSAADIRATEEMVAKIRAVYERYGFEPVETPFFEYTEALGKFLPDQDRPNEGVFSLQDDDEQWMSLRYDLTAPLARTFAENARDLPRPYRTYRFGWVFRNEKPGPGRFRQFMQFDADTVGAPSPAADAEMCMMAADTLEALGIARGDYVIKYNTRRVIDGLLEAIDVTQPHQQLTVLRAIDKLDRLGLDGVRQLLGTGRTDESGDRTAGAALSPDAIDTLVRLMDSSKQAERLIRFLGRRWTKPFTVKKYQEKVKSLLGLSKLPEPIVEGFRAIETIRRIVRAAGYDPDRIRIDPSVVRGLEYYTGAVFEAELLAEIPNEKGQPVVFGSVGGGGRYDGLVGRFMKENVPATGFSLGVSRLQAALTALGRIDTSPVSGPVVVTVMDRDRIADYQTIVTGLRNAGIAAELYLGSSGNLGKQLKYADKRNAPAAVIQGDDEKARGVVQVKDLALGKQLAEGIADHEAWKAERPGQFEVAEDALVEAIGKIIDAAGS